MIPRNQETAYDSVNEMRTEISKNYSRHEVEWDDYNEMEYGHKEGEDY